MSDPVPLRAALSVLVILQTIMLANLYAGVPPHPPVAVAPFAISPFLAVAIGIAVAAFQLAHRRVGRALAGLATALALVSFGPQKYVDPAFPQIWPAVLTAQIATVAIAAILLHPTRSTHKPVSQTSVRL